MFAHGLPGASQEQKVDMQARQSTMIAEMTLSWINEQLREEWERRQAGEIEQQTQAAFWKNQARRLLSVCVLFFGWVAVSWGLGG